MGVVGHRDQEDAAISRSFTRRLTSAEESFTGLYTHQVCFRARMVLGYVNIGNRFFSNFVVWVSAFWNQHYMVAFATLIGLLALVFQPVASAMFNSRLTYLAQPRE